MTGAAAFPGVGVLYRATDQMPFLELAYAAADRGFTSLVLGEHTHIPVSSDPACFPGAGDTIPPTYPRLLDPYIALSFVAARTPMKIATCTSLPAQHDPIALAKALATLDHLSGGRLTLGVGYGWNADELVSHGHAWKNRRAVVREHVELMRALWTETEAEYHGQYANLERSWSWPKPAQPSIPVLLGAAGRGLAMEAIVGWADGWMPGGSISWIADRLVELRRRWAEAGRPASGPVIWVVQDPVDDDRFQARLERLASLGVAEVVVAFDTVDKDEILPVLDRYAKLIAANAG
ncbi:TIGR03619 family F420-dependent LLM class oxidoreductase [Pseudofrankia saprophytica]|uniref:TIGR03619 family F420-dependent LLM class oxidoreductase n=1 Tax=Pseudofrankia saprophytica TaxID=298655 RepID=UPI000234D7F3|nr:TIGR03619 family F420-dependent LLM class oxidoreductase [Pseudofrankia saprophytica]